MHETPAFPAHSRVSWGAWQNAGLPGWGGSADRVRLQENSLLSGNLTGNFTILGGQPPSSSLETAAMRAFVSQFPTQTNREIILGNRDVLTKNREFYVQMSITNTIVA
jgi:hypothetical protein